LPASLQQQQRASNVDWPPTHPRTHAVASPDDDAPGGLSTIKYRAGIVDLAMNYYRPALARGCESQSRARSLFLPLARKRMFRVTRFPHRARPPAGFRIGKCDPRTHRRLDALFDYRDLDPRRN